ncbi:hypothetical protein Vafri_12856 [Volvox africanus]|uniref:Uncharacterized protein n=1 Tax=Volvox africanus TaxID=51714 RepID=A0A8J4BB73_9CHLO|nr:hypothetical protein Vafri_12856 [Volvox africanus]
MLFSSIVPCIHQMRRSPGPRMRMQSPLPPACPCKVPMPMLPVTRHVTALCPPHLWLPASLFAFAWDMWLAAAWDRWQLERRQRKRARGVQFGQEQDVLDLGSLLADRLEGGAAFAPSGRQAVSTATVTTETVASSSPSAALPSLQTPRTGPNAPGA